MSHRFPVFSPGLSAILLLSLLPGVGYAEAAAPEVTSHELEITGNDSMEFIPTSVTVPAGVPIRVTFRNVGKLPKFIMGHNLVILRIGTNVDAFGEAGSTEKKNGYISESMRDQVIAASGVIGPRRHAVLELPPLQAGDYPFVCTFPGHHKKMRGVMTVK
jgi:azurin